MKNRIKKAIKDVYWGLLSKVWWARRNKLALRWPDNANYSIGVVTYINRYERFFRPLLRNLCSLFPDTEIVVAVNGYYDKARQIDYLQRITGLMSKYPNVKHIQYMEGQSLSKLWNQLVIGSRNNKLFIFNDDLTILPNFRREVERSGILDEEVALINRSWSHFLISKRTISTVGWFDERFPGVGNEDEDFEARLVLAGIGIRSFSVKGLRNVVFQTTDFSYGQDTKVVNVKYVSANKEFFDKKWQVSEVNQDGFVFVSILGKYARLQRGMETPDFYPDLALVHPTIND